MRKQRIALLGDCPWTIELRLMVVTGVTVIVTLQTQNWCKCKLIEQGWIERGKEKPQSSERSHTALVMFGREREVWVCLGDEFR